MEHAMDRWSKQQRKCVARFLLCVWRLGRRGNVVIMDPAVLEEMLEQLREVCTLRTHVAHARTRARVYIHICTRARVYIHICTRARVYIHICIYLTA